MKSLKYLLISLLVICHTADIFACLHPTYAPSGYYMYRVYDADPTPELAVKGAAPTAAQNCQEWQKLTSSEIPLEDIYAVVYTMSLEEFEDIYDHRRRTYENSFTEWITKKDTAILDFLLLAKTNEYIRLKRNSRWYYPSMKIGARMTLEEVAEKALAAKDNRLRDRYLLQAVRALFSLGKYDECIELWNGTASRLTYGNLMREFILPYIAGAEYRVGNKEKAMRLFAEIGDVESLLFCAGRSGEKLSPVDAIELICRHCPNSPYIPKALQAYVRSIEPDGELGQYLHSDWGEEERKIEIMADFTRLSVLSQRKARVSNQPMWYYTAAFLCHLKGDFSKTSEYLAAAMRTADTASPTVLEGMQIFNFYLSAQRASYDSAFEGRLLSRLKWFEKKITENLTEKVKEEVTSGYKLQSNMSFFYWNDMLRRVLLAEVCPRMIEAGKPVRALQLANMADNYLYSLVNEMEVYDSTINEWRNVPMREYRYLKSEKNYWDYSNNFFQLIDSLGIQTTKQYVKRVAQPQDEFDKFLNARGYTESDYLNDIVGTQCLRKRQYAEAEKYLSKVSEEYYYHHNLEMKYDPFSLERSDVACSKTFKYDFAKEMNSLEGQIAKTADPNRKAELMVRFAIGLRSSFDRCWMLTQYYRGGMFERDWESDANTKAAMKRVEKMTAQACQMATDPEVAAEINYTLCNYKTVAEKYPDTEKGKLVRGECDKLIDYHAERYTPTPREREGY